MTRQNFFIALILLMLFCILYLYQSFLMNFLIASLICIATFDIKKFFDKYLKNNFFSSFFAVFSLLLFLILPLVFLVQQAILFFINIKGEQLSSYLNASKTGISELFEKIPIESFSLLERNFEQLTQKFSVQNIVDFGLKISSYVGKESLYFLLDIGFIVVFLFFLFFYGQKIYIQILKILPFSLHQSHAIFEEVSGVLKIVLFTSLINVLLQGFAFGIIMSYFGYDNSLLLGVLYGIAALVPIIGGALVWFPVVGYELYLGHIKEAIIIAIYALVFIGFVIDNVIKPFVIGFVNKKILKKPLKVNEIVIFFAIIAGFSSFGFWGIVIGPAITACFISLLRLYQNRVFKKMR